MKTELSQYIRRLESSYDGRPWYGESLLQKLEQIGPKEAFAVPVPGVHSVAQIVAHILVWRRILTERLKGNSNFKVEMNSTQDWPSVTELREKGWEILKSELAENQRELVSLLSNETDALLDRIFEDDYKFRFLIEGIFEHDLYHLGQIGLAISLYKNMMPA